MQEQTISKEGRAGKKTAYITLKRWNRQIKLEHRVHVAAVAGIFAVTLILFAPLLSGKTFSMVGAHMYAQYPWMAIIKDNPEIGGRGYPLADHAESFYPTSVFATNAIRSGQIPMWFPYSFGGLPAMEIGVSSSLLYPPKLLMMTFLSPIRTHDLMLLTHLLLAGLVMYALLRCWGANVFGAVLGAIVWELNGQQAFFLTFELVAIAELWFPLVMLGATLTIRKQSVSWALVTGAALGMSILGGIYSAYVSAWVLTCWYFVLTMLAAVKLFSKRQHRAAIFCLSLPLISAAVAATLGAASWLSLFGLLSHVHREPAPILHQLDEAIPLWSLLRALVLPKNAGNIEHTAHLTAYAFVGTPALILSVSGFFRRRRPVILANIVGLTSVSMLLGVRPLIILFRAVIPYFGAIHLNVGFFLFCFAIATLAAFGLTDAYSYFSQRKYRSRLFPGIVLPLIAVITIAVASMQLIHFAWLFNPIQPATPEWLFPETPLISSLKANQGDFHILPIYQHDPARQFSPPPMVLAGKVSADFELRSGSGYEELLPLTTAMLWGTVERDGTPARPSDIPPVYRPYFSHGALAMTLLQNISVGLLAAPPSTKPIARSGVDPVSTGDLQLIYGGPDGQIFKVTHALRRAFLTPRVVTAPDNATALKMLANEKFDAREQAIIVGERKTAETHLPLGETSSDILEGSAMIVRDKLNEVVVEVNSPRPAMLVLNDSWDSGWKARVDDAGASVFRVNFAFRGVVVPEGKHQVAFLYRPTLLLIGLAISSCTLLLLVILWLRIGLRAVLQRFRLKEKLAS